MSTIFLCWLPLCQEKLAILKSFCLFLPSVLHYPPPPTFRLCPFFSPLYLVLNLIVNQILLVPASFIQIWVLFPMLRSSFSFSFHSPSSFQFPHAAPYSHTPTHLNFFPSYNKRQYHTHHIFYSPSIYLSPDNWLLS